MTIDEHTPISLESLEEEVAELERDAAAHPRADMSDRTQHLILRTLLEILREVRGVG